MSRVFVYVDGFNLFHAIDDLRDNRLKWLDLWKLSQGLCSSDEVLSTVYYFSAYATWKPDAYKIHRDYVRALTANGVKSIMGKFKAKNCKCKYCKTTWQGHEEKETDVNIAIQLVHDAHGKNYDRAILITGDSDLAPAAKKVREINPTAQLSVWVPPGRNRGCDSLGPRFEIRRARIENCQLPDKLFGPDGSVLVERPTKYR